MIYTGHRHLMLYWLAWLAIGLTSCGTESPEVQNKAREEGIVGATVQVHAGREKEPTPSKYTVHPTPDQSAPFGVYIPKDLHDAFIELERMTDPRFLAEFQSGTDAELDKYHHGMGMWIRNNWALWKGSRLTDYFVRLGIHHPDDMSGIILTSFHRHLNGKPIKLDEQVRYYQAFWNSPEVKKMMKDEEESRLKAIRDEEKRAKATPEELLILAAKGREIKIVTQLLDQGVNPNAVNPDGMSVLAYMAGWGEADTVQMLLDKGASVNAPSAGGRTALMAAAYSGQVSVVQALLDRGADVNAKSLDGRTALMFAAQDGDVEIVRSLMDQRADVHARATDGWTALMFAASYGNADALQELLRKSDVNAETPEGMTALKAAVAAGHRKETELLKQAGAKR